MLLLVNLLGGIGLFLLGMTMLTDGLKLAAGGALERILAAWTRTRLYGLLTGILVTALVQSSTAMTVAAIGFVNAGLLSFTSALWVVFGSNLGSSVTGWLVALIGFKFKIDAFALPFIGVGMALKLSGEGTRRGGLGGTLAGFGLLFLGIDLLKEGFGGLGPDALPEMGRDLGGMLLAVLVGLLLTVVLQASAATLTVVLTAVAGGMIPLEIGAAIVIGANVGTTLTGIVAAINATPNA
ncbi:MAG: Na/Pi symporter, partial [Aquabacterium sp.]|nr:Na/Pi symporter [Aquabacterium sp.]